MYPNVPYDGLSWPITQHSGVISERIIRGLINACMLCNGRDADSEVINNYIVSNNLLTQNFRADSGQIDAWRDYQQILSEFGLIYSTRVCRQITLTPIAIAFADGDISYEEMITLQILRYQYPNGHKSQLSPSLVESYPGNFTFNSYTEFQASCDILVRPAVVILKTLYLLYERGEQVSLTIDELQRYVVRCLRNSDVPFCVEAIIQSRHTSFSLSPLGRARRNMQDWIKLLNNTPLFNVNDRQNTLFLTQYSIDHKDEILRICESLSDPAYFWIFNSSIDFKSNWFAYYGSINLGINLIPSDSRDDVQTSTTRQDDGATTRTISHSRPDTLTGAVRNVELQSFSPIVHSNTEPGNRQVVSVYDYRQSETGRKLHDNMVNMLAQRCVSKGADVFYDSSTVDLYVKNNGKEYMVEVKSITPSNFISRLRYAIGQVKQYDYMLPQEGPRRLGLAFTAAIPSDSWSIPFVIDHLDMDLICMESNDLIIHSRCQESVSLFSA